MLALAAVALGVFGVAAREIKGFQACQPCAQNCAVPCNTPHAALPVVWDDTQDHEDDLAHAFSHGEFNLNPYNSVRPEYRDTPPSKADLAKIWQHHLGEHSYKSPFVRPMKSGLWEAGVPNRYAPSGYNRRKFKTEKEALKYVRHKTGAGSNIIYEPNNAGDAPLDALDAPVDDTYVPLEEDPEPEPEVGLSESEAALPLPDDAAPIAELFQEEDNQGEDEYETDGAFLEIASFSRHSTPTIDEDKVELHASASKLNADTISLNEEEQDIRDERDHNVKVAHKIRDFLSNYRPDHKVEPTGTTLA